MVKAVQKRNVGIETHIRYALRRHPSVMLTGEELAQLLKTVSVRARLVSKAGYRNEVDINDTEEQDILQGHQLVGLSPNMVWRVTAIL